jgi:hypothetical protein
MTNERNADAARDGLALVRLALHMCDTGDRALLDRGAADAILQNGDPGRIAGLLAAMFASLLHQLQEDRVITSAAEVVNELQRVHVDGPPDA